MEIFLAFFSNIQPPKGTVGFNDSDEDRGMSCDCRPSCNTQSYQVNVISSKRLSGENSFNSTVSSIHIYFKDFFAVKYRKDVYMSWDAFFAAFGGIFGLCLGGSIISLIEVFYYFIIKIFSLIYCKKKIPEKTPEIPRNPPKVKQILTITNFNHKNPKFYW